jgi:hypothetical protein
LQGTTTLEHAASLVRLTASFVAPMVVTVLAQRAWLVRMTRARRARGWSVASWGMAVLWLGPLSMIPFAWVTRRRRGLLEGLLAIARGVLGAAGLLAACAGIDLALAWALGLEP